MRISSIVSLVSSSKISDVIDKILDMHLVRGRGTYETMTDAGSCCYFWAMTPAKAKLLVRQLPHRRFWIFEGHFPGSDPTTAHSVGLLLSHIDGLSRIVAMGNGQAWYFDHFDKLFRKNGASFESCPHDLDDKGGKDTSP